MLVRDRIIYEIQGTIPRYKNYLIKKLKAGTVIKIHHIASYDLILNKHTNLVLDNHLMEWLSSAFIFALK